MTGPPPLLTKTFGLLVLGHFLQALGFGSLLLLPLYLDHLGASHTQIGAIMAAPAVGGLASRPLVGWALDRVGRRPTLLAGTGVLVLSMALLFWVRDLGPLIYVDRILFGVGAGTLFTGYFTWATDLIPEARRTEGIAVFGISGLLPMGLNAFVGDLGIEPQDLRLLFAGLAGMIALSIPILLALPEARRARTGASLGEVLLALRRRPLWPVWAATALFAGLVGVFMAFATVTAQGRGSPNPAGLWLTYVLGAAAVRLVGGRLPDRVGTHNLVAPALGSYALAFVVLAVAEQQSGFWLAGLLGGIGHGYCFPVVVSQVVTRSPAAWRGSAMATFTAAWQGSELAFPPLFGAVADRAGEVAMLGLVVLAALVGLLGWAALEHRALASDGPERAHRELEGPRRSCQA